MEKLFLQKSSKLNYLDAHSTINYLRGFIHVKLEAMTRIYFSQGLKANLRTNKNKRMLGASSIIHGHPQSKGDQALKTITKGTKSKIKTQSKFVPLEE
jgi:hypothetical protein